MRKAKIQRRTSPLNRLNNRGVGTQPATREDRNLAVDTSAGKWKRRGNPPHTRHDRSTVVVAFASGCSIARPMRRHRTDDSAIVPTNEGQQRQLINVSRYAVGGAFSGGSARPAWSPSAVLPGAMRCWSAMNRCPPQGRATAPHQPRAIRRRGPRNTAGDVTRHGRTR